MLTFAKAHPGGLLVKMIAASEGQDAEQRLRSRNEWTAYLTLSRIALTKHGIVYGTQVLWRQSSHSSLRTGKPSTRLKMSAFNHGEGEQELDTENE